MNIYAFRMKQHCFLIFALWPGFSLSAMDDPNKESNVHDDIRSSIKKLPIPPCPDSPRADSSRLDSVRVDSSRSIVSPTGRIRPSLKRTDSATSLLSPHVTVTTHLSARQPASPKRVLSARTSSPDRVQQLQKEVVPAAASSPRKKKDLDDDDSPRRYLLITNVNIMTDENITTDMKAAVRAKALLKKFADGSETVCVPGTEKTPETNERGRLIRSNSVPLPCVNRVKKDTVKEKSLDALLEMQKAKAEGQFITNEAKMALFNTIKCNKDAVEAVLNSVKESDGPKGLQAYVEYLENRIDRNRPHASQLCKEIEPDGDQEILAEDEELPSQRLERTYSVG